MTVHGLGLFMVLVLLVAACVLAWGKENERCWQDLLINEFALNELEWTILKCNTVAHSMAFKASCPDNRADAVRLLQKYDWI